MSFPIPFSIHVDRAPGHQPMGQMAPEDAGNTGSMQGNPSDYMQTMFNLMRKIHGRRQTMGNYASQGGTTNVSQL